MRKVLTMMAVLALCACGRGGEATDPAAQRRAVSRACVEGGLRALGLKLDKVGCACAANVLQAQLSPAAMRALEAQASGDAALFSTLRGRLPADERALLDPAAAAGGRLAAVIADCL